MPRVTLEIFDPIGSLFVGFPTSKATGNALQITATHGGKHGPSRPIGQRGNHQNDPAIADFLLPLRASKCIDLKCEQKSE
jgi:hypothetical protein